MTINDAFVAFCKAMGQPVDPRSIIEPLAAQLYAAGFRPITGGAIPEWAYIEYVGRQELDQWNSTGKLDAQGGDWEAAKKKGMGPQFTMRLMMARGPIQLPIERMRLAFFGLRIWPDMFMAEAARILQAAGAAPGIDKTAVAAALGQIEAGATALREAVDQTLT
ncbi:hypothetical protein [Novosphingobium album (ex Liu et al. 2023)]|uniref:Uncharacterized protein n=1 Tax=Novosphingobium album (ex Liu et al. 2023) TaxID=3031130 RepID=A0ABT5WXX5_9SPHN|nr:hypothetical protein [Novosphingobium album (ex Liu et al. 2023)]MDE8654760.1 hypothetical protein [Novosphingobium album (ex Liu et al. 2023)]